MRPPAEQQPEFGDERAAQAQDRIGWHAIRLREQRRGQRAAVAIVKISFLPTTTSDEMLTLAMARSDSFHSDVCVTSTRTRAVFGVPRAY